MTDVFEAKCPECRISFTVLHGGGVFYHLVRCENCGKTKGIGFDELGELHLRYLKGIGMPYCVASSEHDRYVQEHVQVEPISEDEYNRGIAAIAGTCLCGGSYCLDAPPRCPKCRSTRIDEGEIPIRHYD